MHDEVLPKGTKELLAKLQESQALGKAYLAGGTNIALQLGHRISRDLDFFTPEDFDEKILSQRFGKLGITIEQLHWRTMLGFADEVKFSYFYYAHPLLLPPLLYEGTQLASLKDAAAMKIEAIGARGTKRDFIDLYCVLRHEQMTLDQALDYYGQKYGEKQNTLMHALKSLVYFADADADTTPLTMLKPVEWNEVKKFFDRETEYAKKKL